MEHCIECNQELEIRLNAFVCTYPSCPLKGLLQVGVENLKEECEHDRIYSTTGGSGICEKCGQLKPIETEQSSGVGWVAGVVALTMKKPKRWKPRKGNEFFSIYTDGAIEQYIWEGSEYDNQIHQFGNCFKTREEAELMRDKIRDLLNQ